MRLESLPALIPLLLRTWASDYLLRDPAFNSEEAPRIREVLLNLHDHKWLQRKGSGWQVKGLVMTDWFSLIRLKNNNICIFNFLSLWVRHLGLESMSVFCFLSDSRWKALGMSGLLRRLPKREWKCRNCCVLLAQLITIQPSTFSLKSKWLQDPMQPSTSNTSQVEMWLPALVIKNRSQIWVG